MMQKFLMKINTDTINIIIEILSDSLEKIIIDTYGNYFCQKLIHSCNNNQKVEIIKHVKKLINDINNKLLKIIK